MTTPRGQRSVPRILVVDTDVTLSNLLSTALRYEGWEVVGARSGRDAIELAASNEPAAVVLDMKLPDMHGMELVAKLRELSADLPVLFLTPKDGDDERIAGLTAGGDDYVSKPFRIEELVARLRALLRRAGMAPKRAVLTVGDLTLDENSHEVRRGGEQVNLTATEYELLRYLMRNNKRVLSKAQILDRVWKYDFGGRANVVELYISYLRKKVDAGRTPMIHTMRGVGYVLKPAS
jgi:two-component system, OmpR family, response regulator